MSVGISGRVGRLIGTPDGWGKLAPLHFKRCWSPSGRTKGSKMSEKSLTNQYKINRTQPHAIHVPICYHEKLLQIFKKSITPNTNSIQNQYEIRRYQYNSMWNQCKTNSKSHRESPELPKLYFLKEPIHNPIQICPSEPWGLEGSCC